MDGKLSYLVDARGLEDAKQEFSYDSLNRLINVKYYDTDDVTVLEEYTISYNTKNQITLEAITIYYSGTQNTLKSYTYDDLGRLVSETVNSVETVYTYDAVGNRTSMTQGANVLYYDYNDYDQLTRTATDDDLETSDIVAAYAYDISGNQISMAVGDTVTRYYYDDANWLSSVTEQVGLGTESTIASYEYDPSGQRTQKTVGSDVVNYYYSGLDLLYTTDGSGGTIEENILETDGSIINSKRVNAQSYWYRQDIRGSVTNIVDVSDVLVKSYTYDAYGNTSSTGTFVNSFAYTGAVIDAETGLYYMNARYYDPETGRFISQDSYRGDGEAFWHLYAYCFNDPVNMADQNGQKPEAVSKITKKIFNKLLNLYKYSTFYGAATKYVKASSTSGKNCYAYAIGRSKALDPGSLSGCSPANNDVYAIANAVIRDLLALGRTARMIQGWYSQILKNEYRIAVRCGANDYHFMRQNNDGSWSEKPGRFLASKNHPKGVNPDDISWDLPKLVGFSKNYYNSEIIYIAIGK